MLILGIYLVGCVITGIILYFDDPQYTTIGDFLILCALSWLTVVVYAIDFIRTSKMFAPIRDFMNKPIKKDE